MIRPRHVALVAAILIALALGLWSFLRDRGDAARTSDVAGDRHAATTHAPEATRPPPAHVTQVSAEERRRLADEIAAAHARGPAAHTAPDRPALPALPALPVDEAPHDLDRIGEHVRDALQEAVPFLAACYEQHGYGSGSGSARPRSAIAMMRLTGDPDIGTVIDADQIVDVDQHPLDPALDACLRSTIQTLELPPLDEGDAVSVQYSFKFD